MAQHPDAPRRTASVPAVLAAAAVSWGQERCDRAAGRLVPVSSQQADAGSSSLATVGRLNGPVSPTLCALCLSWWP